MEATVTISLNEYLALKEIKEILDLKPNYIITEGIFGGYNYVLKPMSYNKVVEDLTNKLKQQVSLNVDLRHENTKLLGKIEFLEKKKSIFDLFK